MKLDGKFVASETEKALKQKIIDLGSKNIKLKLSIVLVGNDPASELYVNLKSKDCAKLGIDCDIRRFSESEEEKTILDCIDDLNNDSSCTGFIIQLPLPKHIDTDKVLEAISPDKDVDGLHPLNIGKLATGASLDTFPVACTPLGIVKLAEYYDIDFASKRVLILGRGKTVGRPLQLLLSRKEYNATTILAHSKTNNTDELVKNSDIIISAMGKGEFVKSDLLNENSVIFDVGVSKDYDGKTVGDFERSSYELVKYYAPVIGGVGPMTRMMLMNNLVKLAKLQSL